MDTSVEEKLYTIKEVSEMFGVTIHTLRYYTDCGLIPTVKRDKNNNRLFDKKSLDWLTGNLCLRKCGMSIEDLKSYVDLCLEGDSTIRARYNILLKQKKIAEEECKEAAKRLKYLENKLARYEEIMNGIGKDTFNPVKW